MLIHHVQEYLKCTAIQGNFTCPQDYLQYSNPSMTIAAAVVIGLFCIASLLFLVGTPAQSKLWKYWVAKLVISCHCCYGKEGCNSWAVMPEWNKSVKQRQISNDGNNRQLEDVEAIESRDEQVAVNVHVAVHVQTRNHHDGDIAVENKNRAIYNYIYRETTI